VVEEALEECKSHSEPTSVVEAWEECKSHTHDVS
jgi:hypothetical protein